MQRQTALAGAPLRGIQAQDHRILTETLPPQEFTQHRTPLRAQNSSRFGPYRGEVTEMITGGVYKYYVGCVASYKEALSLQSKLRSQFKDAFVVPFLGDKRITIAEARRLE